MTRDLAPARATSSLGTAARSLSADQSGAAYTEILIALVPLLLFFLGLYQYVQLSTADLVVRRAAHAAVRAAVVVYPDEARYYGGAAKSARSPYVEEAARRTLFAVPELDMAGLRVSIAGDMTGHSDVNVVLRVPYHCTVPLGKLVCGADGLLELSASAVLPYLDS